MSRPLRKRLVMVRGKSCIVLRIWLASSMSPAGDSPRAGQGPTLDSTISDWDRLDRLDRTTVAIAAIFSPAAAGGPPAGSPVQAHRRRATGVADGHRQR